jgi:dihydrofolate reductase
MSVDSDPAVSPAPRMRVYIASSLDGFIAGPGDDLSWLTGPDAANQGGSTDAGALTFDDFMTDVGAVLMGRSTFEVVRRMEWWGYGERPVLVATHRDLGDVSRRTVQAVSGSIGDIVDEARKAADGKDVYIDGGNLIRQAAEADLIDDITITMAPIALGAGHPLFAGLTRRYPLEILAHHTYEGGMVQIRAKPQSRR